MQLVAEQQGGPSSSSPPPPNCSLRQMLRWKHTSSNAVAVVAKAVLQGKVPQLEAAIEQRRARDAQIAEGEKKLTAMMEVFRQEMQRLRNPGSGQQSDGDGGLEPFSTDGLGNQLATAAAVNMSQGAVVAAEDGRGAAPGTAAKKRPGPVITPAAAAAGAATATGTGTPPDKRVKAQGGTGCSCWVVWTGGDSSRATTSVSCMCFVCHMQASLTRLTRPPAVSCSRGVLGCSFLASAAAWHSRPLMQRQRHMTRSWGEAADSVRVFWMSERRSNIRDIYSCGGES